jgi:ribosomal protection tetracycline resistance protein
MGIVNLGILAHVDAGKTSLTERLLFDAGVITHIGRVDDGTTQTDSLALERQRGITIKSAVVSFNIGNTTVNLIDTPGHPDFIAEVERVLSLLNGAVLVVSAVEGVQAQTRVLMRVLRRLRIPTLVFVNKVDRAGARPDLVLADIAAKLSPSVVGMGFADRVGTRDVVVHRPDDTGRLLEVLAEHDDDLLAGFVDGSVPAGSRLRHALVDQVGRGLVHPVYFGSAVTGAGVAELAAGIACLLPSATGDPDGPAAGVVFKVDRGDAGEKVAYVRMFSGTVRVRDRLRFREDATVTGIGVFEDGSVVRRAAVSAGRIGRLWGLGDVRIGDVIGTPDVAVGRLFAPPTLETVVVPDDPADRGALYVALTRLAEQDPLIGLRLDEVRQEIAVSLYGEVQKEVIEATLRDGFGLGVAFLETTTICIERPTGTGSAVQIMGQDGNPFLATVGLRVEPAAVGSGVGFGLGVELGSMPYAFFKAVEDTVHDTLRQGLHGWQVTDCLVTMTHSGYAPRQSHAHARFDKSMSSTGWDFRSVTPLVLMAALRRAGTAVLEPMHRFRLDIPADTLNPVLHLLVRARGVLRGSATVGASCLLDGDIPAAMVHDVQRRLPALTRGEGSTEWTFDHYRPVRDTVPERTRWDHNPLNRKEYLLHVRRRV